MPRPSLESVGRDHEAWHARREGAAFRILLLRVTDCPLPLYACTLHTVRASCRPWALVECGAHGRIVGQSPRSASATKIHERRVRAIRPSSRLMNGTSVGAIDKYLPVGKVSSLIRPSTQVHTHATSHSLQYGVRRTAIHIIAGCSGRIVDPSRPKIELEGAVHS